MADLTVLEAAVNRVTLRVDLQGHACARIYRSGRKAGPYEAVGIAYGATCVDVADLTPGRTYYYRAVLCRTPYFCPEFGAWDQAEPVAAAVPRAPRERRVVLTRQRQAFGVRMGGYLDESNTVTRVPETYCPGPNASMPPYEQVFEPNLYVAVENLGETDVVNPWLVANGQRDWWSAETIVREILGGRALTETEKAMAVWRFVCEEMYDSRAGLSWYDGMSDPVKVFNVYGFEGCVANAVVSRRLAETMGLSAREVWLGGVLDGHGRGRSCAHDIFEVYANGAWHLLDTDQMLFFLKRDNRTVAGAGDLARDVDLLQRSHRNLGLCGRDMTEKDFYSEQFRTRQFVYPPNKGGVWMDNAGTFTHASGEYPPPHTMSLRLRPGEKLVRYWGNVGKVVIRALRLHPEVRYSNGKLVYRPDLRRPVSMKGAERLRNVTQACAGKRPALHPSRIGAVSEAVWKVLSPYAIAGARVGLKCRRNTQEDGLEVLLSKDGENWRSLWFANGRRQDVCLELDWFLNPALNDWRGDRDLAWRMGPCYAYYIKVAMWAGSHPEGVGLDAIRFDTDLQCATRSLPSLFCGDNTVAYRDDNRGPRKVRVTYGWQEEREVRPPQAPDLVFPKPDADVNRLDFEFRWCRPKGGSARVDDYHVQVSRYPDFRWCACPTFDRYVSRTAYTGKTRWQPQFPNLLNPDETYYWRVRARNARGVWGTWSEARAFVPHGPRHPVDLAVRRQRGGRALSWTPNSQGNPPVAYRVYGSSESDGFSVSEGNLLGTTEEALWRLEKGRRLSYRVVAVDANGALSTPSDYV